MSDIKLDPEERALYEEVGSRGDYFREAIRDRAVQQVNETGRMSEITTAGNMVDAVLAPNTATLGDTVTDVVPPSDFSSVVGQDAEAEPDRPQGWPDKDVSGA